jgi:hypothetical protein
MTNKEKAREIRHALEGMPCAICTKNMTDKQCVDLYDSLESEIKNRFSVDVMDLDDDEQSTIWWNFVERDALVEYACEYYEDMTNEDYDKCKNWFSTWKYQDASDR